MNMNKIILKLYNHLKWSFLYRLRKNKLYHYFFLRYYGKIHHQGKTLKLHIGSGGDYTPGWINIDHNKLVPADLYMDMRKIRHYCRKDSVNELKMIHVISYLRYWEAIDFLNTCYDIMRPVGYLLIEGPDILKLSENLQKIKSLNVEADYFMYFECLRAIYAFNMDQIKNKNSFITYAFGWSARHLKYELEKIGFRNIKISSPLYHDKLPWRDFHVEATK